MFEDLFSKAGLSLDRLRMLCEVAEAGGISRAAPGDPTRQSQISRQLKELEDFFETELTRRRGKGMELTEAGEDLARHARETLLGLQDFRLRWTNRPQMFSIGAGDSLLEWLVVPNIAGVGLNATFRLRNLRTRAIVSSLQDLSLDFGLIRKNSERSPLKYHPLGTLEYALYCPKAIYNKCGKTDLLQVLQTAPLALLDSDGDFMRDFNAWIQKNRALLSVKLACDSLPKALCALKTGRYAAVLPTIAAHELPSSEYAKVALPSKIGSRVICLAWNPRTLRLRSLAPKVADFLTEKLRF